MVDSILSPKDLGFIGNVRRAVLHAMLEVASKAESLGRGLNFRGPVINSAKS